MHSLLEYQCAYVTCDVLILADVFEEFCRMPLEYYKLDPAHYFTTPGLTFQAALRYSKVDLKLFTDLNMLLTVEKGI